MVLLPPDADHRSSSLEIVIAQPLLSAAVTSRVPPAKSSCTAALFSLPLGLGCASTRTDPLPTPLEAPSKLSQVALTSAFQAQPASAVMVIVCAPPPLPNCTLLGLYLSE